jgi:hypothetical protein
MTQKRISFKAYAVLLRLKENPLYFSLYFHILILIYIKLFKRFTVHFKIKLSGKDKKIKRKDNDKKR